jgi:hypothetical protein
MGVGEVVSDEPGFLPFSLLLEDTMSVWTILQYNQSTGDMHASTLFGSPDRVDAWEKAEKLADWECNVVAIWKGNFADEVVTEKPKKE